MRNQVRATLTSYYLNSVGSQVSIHLIKLLTLAELIVLFSAFCNYIDFFILALTENVLWHGRLLECVKISVKMYHELTSSQGNFNQGNVTHLRDTAGTKCAYNVLFPLCWLVVGTVSIWKSYGLDNILTQGEK